MRKGLSLLLALLMVLPMFGCAAIESGNDTALDSASVIATGELSPMATIASKFTSTVASADGYIRSAEINAYSVHFIILLNKSLSVLVCAFIL